MDGDLHGFLDGCVLHVDVSGFTALTERLMKEGHQGAEEISASLNAIFGSVSGIISSHGGFIATFAGDSFTAVFPDRSLAACKETAGVIQRVLGDLEPSPGFRPEYRFCLSSGEMEWGITGGAGMRAYFFRGEPVYACATLAERCAPGELAVEAGNAPEPIDAGARGSPARLPDGLEECFVPAEALARERSGEFREVVSVFTGFEEDISYGELDGLTRLLLQSAESLGGYLSGVFFDEKGGNALTVFGAPRAYERLGQRALEYVAALRKPGHLGIRFGICRGMVYAGRIGSSDRFTYSVIGDPVNTAAKLLNHASPGMALVAHPQDFSAAGLVPEGTVRLEGKSSPVPVAGPVETGSEGRVPGVSRVSLIGRGQQLKRGLELLREVESKRYPAVLYIQGPAGMGKTRLLSELTIGLSPESSRLVLQCDDISGKGMGPVVTMLREYFWMRHPTGGREFESSWASLLNRLRRVEDPRTEESLTELKAAAPALRRLMGLPSGSGVFDSLEPAQRYSNTVFAVKAFLKSLALISPLVLAVEDLHWADQDTREVLETLLRRLEGFPLGLLVTARPEDDGSYSELEVPDGVRVERILLEGLSAGESREMVQRLAGGSPSIRLMEFLKERCRGNPFYLEQYCAYLVEHGLLAASPRGLRLAGGTDVIPEGIRSTILARLDRLPDRLRGLVQTASVLGREFNLRVVARMCGDHDPSPRLDEGRNQGLWTELGNGVYGFSHVLIRDAAYGMQLRESLRKLHRSAAEATLTVFGEDAERLAEVAYHLESAGAAGEAASYLLKAARFADEEYRNREALDLYRRYLEMVGPEGEQTSANRRRETVGVLRSMAEICSVTGRWNRAEELFRAALERVGPKSETGISVMVTLAGFLRNVGRLDEASRILEDCEAGLARWDDPILVADHLLARARVHIDMGEYSQSLEWAKEAMERFLEGGRLEMAVSACRAIGSAKAALGDSRGALRSYQEALGMIEGKRAPVIRAELLGSMGNVHLERQRYDLARDLYTRSLELAEEAGHRQYVGFATGNLGIIHQLQGRLDEAERLLRRQEVIGRELGDRYMLGSAWMNLCLVEMARGNFEKALVLSDSARRAFERIRDRAGVSYASAMSGNLLAFLGRLDDALEKLSEAIALGRECQLGFYLADYLLHNSWVLIQAGGFSKALEAARESMDLSRRLSRIDCLRRAEMAVLAAEAKSGGELDSARLEQLAEEAEEDGTRALAHFVAYIVNGDGAAAKRARETVRGMAGALETNEWRILLGTGGSAATEDGQCP